MLCVLCWEKHLRCCAPPPPFSWRNPYICMCVYVYVGTGGEERGDEFTVRGRERSATLIYFFFLLLSNPLHLLTRESCVSVFFFFSRCAGFVLCGAHSLGFVYLHNRRSMNARFFSFFFFVSVPAYVHSCRRFTRERERCGEGEKIDTRFFIGRRERGGAFDW